MYKQTYAEALFLAIQGEEAMVPEEVGKRAAQAVLEEVRRGGVVDSMHQVQPLDSALHCLWWVRQSTASSASG